MQLVKVCTLKRYFSYGGPFLGKLIYKNLCIVLLKNKLYTHLV